MRRNRMAIQVFELLLREYGSHLSKKSCRLLNADCGLFTIEKRRYEGIKNVLVVHLVFY